MRYQYSLKSIFIVTTVIAGALGCWQISPKVFVWYIVVMSFQLELYFFLKNGRINFRVSVPWGTDIWLDLRRLNQIALFASGGAIVTVLGVLLLLDSFLSMTIVAGWAIGGGSLGIVLWFLILWVHRQTEKDE